MGNRRRWTDQGAAHLWRYWTAAVKELGRPGEGNPAVELSEIGGQRTGAGGVGAAGGRSQGLRSSFRSPATARAICSTLRLRRMSSGTSTIRIGAAARSEEHTSEL